VCKERGIHNPDHSAKFKLKLSVLSSSVFSSVQLRDEVGSLVLGMTETLKPWCCACS